MSRWLRRGGVWLGYSLRMYFAPVTAVWRLVDREYARIRRAHRMARRRLSEE